AVASGATVLDPSQPMQLFATSDPVPAVYVQCTEAFSKPGASVRIDAALDPAQPAEVLAGTAVQLDWRYWNGTVWQLLGRSSSVATSVGSSVYALNDATQALTSNGTVTFTSPGDWSVGSGGEGPQANDGFWLRANVSAGAYVQLPVLRTLAIDYDWGLPVIS